MSVRFELRAENFWDAFVLLPIIRNWPAKHLQLRSELGLAPDSKPLQDTGVRIEGLTNARAMDLCEIAWAARTVEELASPTFYIDISQSADRKPWGTHIRCLTSSSCIVDMHKKRILSPVHHLLLQGHPKEAAVEILTPNMQTKLAGQGMFLPSLATILLPLLVQSRAPWARVAEPPMQRARRS
jgi:hypothetical protein